jgi:thiol-disulfide isomerase/thioredoxin
MRPAWLFSLAIAICPVVAVAQSSSDPIQQALSQGDLYQSKHKYELAQEAYRKADKASHHTSAEAYLKLAAMDRKLGDFSSSLDDTKKALKAAGDNKGLATRARLAHANLLVQTSSKPGDKKLREAEADIREAIALEPSNAVARYNLGYVLLRQEKDPEGIAELNTFLGLPGVNENDLAEAQRMIANPIRAREPFAPDFSFTSHQRQLVSNASLRGKVVLMDFWGTWCPPCRESVPTLQNLQKKYAGKGFELVSVSSDDDEDVWRTFIEAQKMNWTEYIDLTGELLERFKIESFPTYIVLDKDGVMRFRQSGLGDATQQELEDAINKALKRQSDPNLAAAAAASSKEQHSPQTEREQDESRNADASLPASGGATHNSTGDAATLFGIEAGSVTGNIFKNEALSLTYDFPRNWLAAKPDTLQRLNEKMEAAAKASILQQHPEMAADLRIMTPKVVFYASRRGEGDGQRLSFPCIRITASPSRASSLRLDTFRQMSDAMVTAAGAKVTNPAQEYQMNDHSFLRMDFQRSMGGQRVLQTYVQTLSEDYLLTIEIYALSGDDQQSAVDSLQRLLIDDH